MGFFVVKLIFKTAYRKKILCNTIFIFIFAVMNTKWYLGTLIIILALIGLNQEQTKVANQQIVLQFTDVQIASLTAHDDALETITKKLSALGVANIELIEGDDTKLTIRYYSDVDALSVDEFLSQDSELPIDFPTDKLPETCSLVVSDLHQQNYDGLALNGKFVFELKQDHKRFSNPLVLFNGSLADEQDYFVFVAYRINRVVAIAIDNTSHTFPEARAGPNA